jgi:hypothetical protein
MAAGRKPKRIGVNALRALDIFTRTYGPDNPRTRTVAANLEKIKLARSAKQPPVR